MSKTSKFFKHPVLFFVDAYKKSQAAPAPRPATTTLALAAPPTPTPSAVQNSADKKGKSAPKPVARAAPAQKVVPKVVAPNHQSYYLETILEFKRSSAINSLKLGDYFVWPALRAELMIQCDIAWKKNIKNELAFNPYQSQLCRPANVSYEKAVELKSTFANFHHVEDLEVDQCDFLFVSNLNSTDHVESGGKIYNRLIDPLYEAAEKVGTAKKIEIIKAASPAIEKIKRYHNIPLCILPPYIYSYGWSEAMQMPRSFLESLQAKIPFLKFSKDRLESFFDWHFHMKKFYGDLLDKLNPKVIFFLPFYYYTPLIAAARERGIKTVDVQHGVMIGYNTVFYANWQEVPDRGYSAMPDYFLVWSEQEKEHLDAAFSSARGEVNHQAIVSGYAWLDYAVAKSSKAASRLEKINKFTNDARISILITLQRDSVIPVNVEAIIRSGGDEVRWLIRRHPKGDKFTNSVQKLKNVLVGKEVDEADLRDIFECVDYNFTDGSSTVLEADYYNVHSFVYGQEGIMNYQGLIDEGSVGVIPPSAMQFSDLDIGDDRKGGIGYFIRRDLSAMFRSLRGE